MLINDTTYYLGSVTATNTTNDVTTVTSYTAERNASNIYPGNKATWIGKIGLMYPSDYGDSANNSYWNTDLGFYDVAAAKTSWIADTLGVSANYYTFDTWFLTLNDGYSDTVMTAANGGRIQPSNMVYHSRSSVFPVLYLKSSATIMDAAGTKSSPYRVIE